MSKHHRRMILLCVQTKKWIRHAEDVTRAELVKQGYPDWRWFRLSMRKPGDPVPAPSPASMPEPVYGWNPKWTAAGKAGNGTI